MVKVFTLNKRIDKIISDEVGTVTFYITDENGDSREITADTFLDKNKIPQGISSKNKRELPLIEGLFRLDFGESIEIEFKYYNELYNRESDKTVNQVAYEVAVEIQNDNNVIKRIVHLLKNIMRSKRVSN